MKRSATGRILFWRGGSLWIGRAGEPAIVHSHHAVQITLPFPGGCVRLKGVSEGWAEYAAVVIAADQPHSFDARDQWVAQIFIEPESRDGRLLQQRYRSAGIASLPSAPLQRPITDLAAAYETQASDKRLTELARSAVASLLGGELQPGSPPDERVARALVLMRERLCDRMTLGNVAAAVHLSPDRFRHLFVQETGVGFRPYQLWLRLEYSLVAYVAGQTLTEAAYVGGFADSAHFSRTFKRMFGITPASVRPE